MTQSLGAVAAWSPHRGRAWDLRRPTHAERLPGRAREPRGSRVSHLCRYRRSDHHPPRRPPHRLAVDLDRAGRVVGRRAHRSAGCLPVVCRLGVELGLGFGVLPVCDVDLDLPFRADCLPAAVYGPGQDVPLSGCSRFCRTPPPSPRPWAVPNRHPRRSIRSVLLEWLGYVALLGIVAILLGGAVSLVIKETPGRRRRAGPVHLGGFRLRPLDNGGGRHLHVHLHLDRCRRRGSR